MVDENMVEGFAKNVGGRVQDALGGLTGDTAEQARGKVNEAAGSVQNMYGQAVDEVKDFASEQPFTALAASVGVGVVLGFLLGRR